MDAPVLAGTHITQRFFRTTRASARDFEAVSHANLTLCAKELVMLKGRSGSGKSTLLNIMAGLLAPSEGSVAFEGTDLYSLSDAELSRLRNEHFGVVPQGHTGLHALTVAQNVALPAQLYGPPQDGLAERVDELLARVGILELSESYPAELSGGELRRLAIARSLVRSPRVVFADEPTGDLDDESTRAVLELLRSCANDGAAVLLVTHETGVEDYADRVLRMDAGVLS